MVRFRLRLWLTGVVLVGLLIGEGAFAIQQSGLMAFPPTAIGVGIDSSGSTERSDPEGKRIEAVKTLLRTLSLYAGTGDIRFAMVEFGSPALSRDLPRLTVPLTQVQAGSLERILAQIHVRSLRGTDFSSALCLSWLAVSSTRLPVDVKGQCRIPPGELAKIPVVAPTEGQRRVVILFTDGFPAPYGKDLHFSPAEVEPVCQPQPSYASEGHTYMCRLAKLWAGLTAIVPVELYVIGLDATNQWWPVVEPYWHIVTGCGDRCNMQVMRVPDTEALIDTLMQRGLTPPDSYYELCQGISCQISPLVSKALFIIRGPSADHRVLKPDGTALFPDTPRVSRQHGEGIDIWQVPSPEPGEWRVQSKDPRAELRVSLIQTPARLTLHTVPEQPMVHAPFTVMAQVVNPQGGAMRHIPSPATLLSLKLTVTNPGGRQQIREVTGALDATSGMYRFEPPLVVDRAGRHSLKAELTVRDVRLAIGEGEVKVVTPPPPQLTVTRLPSAHVFLSEQFGLRVVYPLLISQPKPLWLNVTLSGHESPAPIPPNRRFVSIPQVSVLLKRTAPCAESMCEIRVDVDLANAEGRWPIALLLPSAWQDRTLFTVQAEGHGVTLDGEPWNAVSNEVTIETKRPGWSRLWDMLGLGYWSPLVLAVLMLGALSLADTRLTRPFQPSRKDRYGDLGVRPLDRPGNRAPVCRLGRTVVWRAWRGVNGYGSYIVTKRWLIVGPLTVRVIPSLGVCKRWYCGDRRLWPVLRLAASQCLLGVPVKQPGIVQINGVPSGEPADPLRFDLGTIAR